MTIAEIMPFSVLLPLIAGPLCAMLPGRRLPWLLCLTIAVGTLAIASSTLGVAVEQPIR